MTTCKHCGAPFELTDAEREEAGLILGKHALSYCSETCFVHGTFPADDATKNSEAAQDPRVVAIRADEKVGAGTCSFIDETYSDRELAEELEYFKVTTPEAAVAWARETDETLWDCD